MLHFKYLQQTQDWNNYRLKFPLMVFVNKEDPVFVVIPFLCFLPQFSIYLLVIWFFCLFFVLIFIYLFIWLLRVIVAACGILVTARGI